MWKKMSAKKCWKVYWVVIGVYWALSRTGQDSGVEDLSTTLARPGVPYSAKNRLHKTMSPLLTVHHRLDSAHLQNQLYREVNIMHGTTSKLSIVHGKFQSGRCQDLDSRLLFPTRLGRESDSLGLRRR